jgi:hypothetical protein
VTAPLEILIPRLQVGSRTGLGLELGLGLGFRLFVPIFLGFFNTNLNSNIFNTNINPDSLSLYSSSAEAIILREVAKKVKDKKAKRLMKRRRVRVRLG